MNYDMAIMRLDLSAFLGAHIEDLPNQEGVTERSVVIPITRNGIQETPRHKLLTYAFVRRLKSYVNNDWTHAIRLKMPKDMIVRLRELGYESPYIGYLKPEDIKATVYNPKENIKRVKNYDDDEN